MRLTISRFLFLAVMTMGLVTGVNAAAEAYPQRAALSRDALVSDSAPQYLAQFPGSGDRPDFDEDDFEDRRDDMEDRLDDMEDRREDMEDRRDDMEDLREDMEDFRDDHDLNYRRRGPRW